MHNNDIKKSADRYFVVYFMLIVVMSILFSADDVLAHKVMIFAWVEGDTVFTQSKFSGGKKVKGAQVNVFDPDENLLIAGKTDEKGEFSFKVLQKTDLKIVLNASMGHMAKWIIKADEINQASLPANSALPAMMINAATDKSTGPKAFKPGSELSTSVPGNQEIAEIKKMIDKSLDQKLAPIIRMLVNLESHEPKITEIIGGIGYIFGVAGVAFYFANRKRKEKR